MSRLSVEPDGTEQDFVVYVGIGKRLTMTVVDQDGAAVDLTGCSLKMLMKQDREAADADGIAATVATVVEGDGTITIVIPPDVLTAGVNYYYDLVVGYPADYATAILQGEEDVAMRGKVFARQEITRDAT